MKVLLLYDKPGWAYHVISNNIIKHNNDTSIKFSAMCIKRNVFNIRNIYGKFDRFFVIGWTSFSSVKFLPKKQTLIGIHSHQGFDRGLTTTNKDILPSKKIVDYLSNFLRVNTVSVRLWNIFTKSGLKTFYTPNGVDGKDFQYINRSPNQFIAGTVASNKHDKNKGISNIIIPACHLSKTKYKFSFFEKRIKHKKMPNYYNKIDCYVCASNSEGMSLSILEAAATGCIIVSTRTGDTPRLINHDRNGYLMNRDKKELASILSFLKKRPNKRKDISLTIRKEIDDKWLWSKTVNSWIDFIKL